MITDKYIKELDNLDDWAQQEARIVANNLLAVQNRIALVYYNIRSGRLVRGLTPEAIQIGSLSESLHLSISYPLHIRFNDMKKKNPRRVTIGGKVLTVRHKRGGRNKQNYAPIYNKYLYGFLLKGLYKRLHNRLGSNISESIHDSLSNIFFDDGR